MFAEKREGALRLSEQNRLDIGRQMASEEEERICYGAKRLRKLSHELLRSRNHAALDAAQKGRIDAKMASKALHGQLPLLPKLAQTCAERG